MRFVATQYFLLKIYLVEEFTHFPVISNPLAFFFIEFDVHHPLIFHHFPNIFPNSRPHPLCGWVGVGWLLLSAARAPQILHCCDALRSITGKFAKLWGMQKWIYGDCHQWMHDGSWWIDREMNNDDALDHKCHPGVEGKTGDSWQQWWSTPS